jgi:hypothetical protein
MSLQDETLQKAVDACNGKNWKKIGLLSALCSASLSMHSTGNSEKTINHAFFFLCTLFLCPKVYLLIGRRNIQHIVFSWKRLRVSLNCCFTSEASCLFALTRA